MDALHLKIEGMTCQHCVRAVESRLRGTPGIEVERVVIGAADIKYNAAAMTVDEIAELIADEGYTASVE
jgi:copper chaperone